MSNRSRLQSLGGNEYTFKAYDSPTGNDDEHVRARKLLDNLMAPEILTIKVGAQVMLVKNMDESLVNGSVGTVEGFGYSMEDYFAQKAEDDPEAVAEFELEEKPRKAAIGGEPSVFVKWKFPGGVTAVTMVERQEFKIEERDKVLACRRQVSWSVLNMYPS
jgi:ATP-dependent DNA helicase PIF1